MTPSRLAGAVAGLIILAGCTAGSPDASSTSSSLPSTPSPSSPSMTSSAIAPPEEVAKVKAEEVLRAYYRSQTECLSDPARSEMTCFDNVAIATRLTDMRNALVSAKGMQTRVNGDIQVVSATPTKVDLAMDLQKTPPVVPAVTFRTCVDVSNFNIVDKDGKSIVPPTRKPRSVASVVMANYKYPDQSQWRVAYIDPDEEATC